MQKDNPHSENPFIDRYMPGASAEERAEAAANLERFVTVLVRIDQRLEREKQEAIRQKADSALDSSVSQSSDV